MPSSPRFLQGVFAYVGAGLEVLDPLDATLTYTVPDGAVGQPVYMRLGNAGDDLAAVVLLRDARPMRWFPVGARAETHVALRVVEDLVPGTVLDLAVSAPAGAAGTLVVDFGLVEV